MMKLQKLTVLILFLGLIACGSDADMPGPTTNVDLPALSVNGAQVVENSGEIFIRFEVVASKVAESDITFDFTVSGITAEPGSDFENISAASATIATGASSVEVSIPIIDDELNEVEEKMRLDISNAVNATITVSRGIGIITDNDSPTNFDAEGYNTATEHFGYNLVWADEFDGTELSTESYNFEIGDGCPNLCGWGNNELEYYTDAAENIRLEDGKLVITATRLGTEGFRSARIQTQDKREFRFGRIDIRAKLPEGKGLWPAIWMLGANISDVGWPASGEIDIMELVGDKPNTIHGTAHWGNAGQPSTFQGSSISLQEKYSEQFHVFSLVWELNELKWYMDETLFHTITPNNLQGETYRFNQAFFFIFNVAVGGNWPGSPNASTQFPQTMEVDYVRVFQPN